MHTIKNLSAGKHTWEAVSIVLRDDVDSVVLRELNNQLNRQVDHAIKTSQEQVQATSSKPLWKH